jgi:2,3-bisphosphoglycerate-dependent phosphoglycerate mutase
MRTAPPPSRPLAFVRHGATEANLAGLRCGGDLDVPLTDLGRRQAAEAALRIRELRLPVGLIVTSALQRTTETAQIIGRVLGGTRVVVEPSFAERGLGSWNLRSIAETESALAAGDTPPGGESDAEFIGRIGAALESLRPCLDLQPLLVGSKGVARALRELLGLPRGVGPANGQLAHFDLAAWACRESTEVPT